MHAESWCMAVLLGIIECKVGSSIRAEALSLTSTKFLPTIWIITKHAMKNYHPSSSTNNWRWYFTPVKPLTQHANKHTTITDMQLYLVSWRHEVYVCVTKAKCPIQEIHASSRVCRKRELVHRWGIFTYWLWGGVCSTYQWYYIWELVIIVCICIILTWQALCDTLVNSSTAH